MIRNGRTDAVLSDIVKRITGVTLRRYHIIPANRMIRSYFLCLIVIKQLNFQHLHFFLCNGLTHSAPSIEIYLPLSGVLLIILFVLRLKTKESKINQIVSINRLLQLQETQGSDRYQNVYRHSRLYSKMSFIRT